jgi:hypothetical protein
MGCNLKNENFYVNKVGSAGYIYPRHLSTFQVLCGAYEIKISLARKVEGYAHVQLLVDLQCPPTEHT